MGIHYQMIHASNTGHALVETYKQLHYEQLVKSIVVLILQRLDNNQAANIILIHTIEERKLQYKPSRTGDPDMEKPFH